MGYEVMGVLSWWGLVTPKFSVPLAAKLCVRPPKVLEVQEHARGPLSPCQVWWGSGFTRCQDSQNVEFLSVCLSVRHAFERQSLCARFRHEGVGLQKRVWIMGKVCTCAPVFNFLRLLPIGDTTKCRTSKNRKNWGFSPPEGDRINRSRGNLARKRIPWVCYSASNLALIGKRGLVQELPKMSNLSKIMLFFHRKQRQWTHSDEILRVSVYTLGLL